MYRNVGLCMIIPIMSDFAFLDLYLFNMVVWYDMVWWVWFVAFTVQCRRRRCLIRDLACGKHGRVSQSTDPAAHAARASVKFRMEDGRIKSTSTVFFRNSGCQKPTLVPVQQAPGCK